MGFSEIKGHERPIKLLKSYIERGGLEGGYLFTGPEGIGKKLTAKALAKTVNCERDGLDACGECASCVKIEKNQLPDVRLIECADGQIKIEDIRQLQHGMGLKPYEAKTRVFIIDNAHKLTAEASNALLKVLEEPPKNSLIILVSDKPGLLFKTVLSRCKILKFSALRRAQLKRLFRDDYRLDENTAHFLAYFSEGRLGCGLRLKDADILRQKNRVIDDFVFSTSPGLKNLQAQGERQDIYRYLNILAAWFRDVYLLKIGMPGSEVINCDRKPDLKGQMQRFSMADLNRIINSISESISYLERNINTKLLIYNLKAQLCSA